MGMGVARAEIHNKNFNRPGQQTELQVKRQEMDHFKFFTFYRDKLNSYLPFWGLQPSICSCGLYKEVCHALSMSVKIVTVTVQPCMILRPQVLLGVKKFDALPDIGCHIHKLVFHDSHNFHAVQWDAL